jgi:hypothetical protein
MLNKQNINRDGVSYRGLACQIRAAERSLTIPLWLTSRLDCLTKIARRYSVVCIKLAS